VWGQAHIVKGGSGSHNTLQTRVHAFTPTMNRRIWITWENQRRSRELADHFGCQLFVFDDKGFWRYPRVILRTLATILRTRPSVVFVQNPSMILAAVAVLIGLATPLSVIVDRHTTFLLNYSGPENIGVRAFRALSWFTLRFADLTIVTNEALATVVRASGGRPAILPDKLPKLTRGLARSGLAATDVASVMFVCSFADDEPIAEVIAAARFVAKHTPLRVFITGRPRPRYMSLVDDATSEVVFTGFLSELDYASLLHDVDIIMVLTTSDCTMLCGCYEAVAAKKPLITSDTDVLREYFVGAVFTAPTVSAIADALAFAVQNRRMLAANIADLEPRIAKSWETAAQALQVQIDELSRT